MLFKRVSRAAAEQVFIVVKNVSGSTITAGYSCAFDTGTSVDGVRVSQVGTTRLQSYAGVADADIANGDYGLIQVYGYRSAVYIKSSTGSSLTGEGLDAVASQWGLRVTGTTVGTAKNFGFLCEAIALSTSSVYSTNFKAFIRAL